MACSGKIILFSALCLIGCFASAQQNNSAITGIRAADSLYNHKLFKASSQRYFACFNQNISAKTNQNLFDAAKACTKANYPDSAYNFLFTLVKQNGSTFFDQIAYGHDFYKLHQDKRWGLLLLMIDRQQHNKLVADELIALRMDRLALEETKSTIARQYGTGSKKLKKLQDSINTVDSVNCRKWKSIMNTYGWLGYAAIGNAGVRAESYLYQKGNISFIKFHFPLIAEAFKSGDINGYDYAVIADRISLYDTGKQIYGTQFIQTNPSATGLFPIENKDSVNIRRHLIGLDPLP